METISNDKITIGVKDHGAELASLVHDGREYMWQADEAFWRRHSPVLFPIVGSLWQGEYRTKGEVYKMGQHGFARDMDFTLISREADELVYALESTAETKARYPYDFRLVIGYKIFDQTVRVSWHVENTGAEVLPFQIGAHPAFFWPMLDDNTIKAGLEAMAQVLNATDKRGYFKLQTKSSTLVKSMIAEAGCFGGETTVALDAEMCLPLTVQTFGKDALVFEDSQVAKVTLCDDDRRPYLSLQFTAPLVGLWSPPGKRAPFVCIEPWYGRADSVNYDGDFSEKKWMQSLASGESFDASYDIIIE